MKEIQAKIKSLLAKTIENGASEAEAMAAIEAANRLMAKHGITLEEVKAGCVGHAFTASVVSDRKKAHPVDAYLHGEVGEFTDTKPVIVSLGRHNKAYTFIGYSVDVDYAMFIRNLVHSAMEAGWVGYKANLPKVEHALKHRSSYMLGMADRVRDKIKELKEAFMSESSSSTELVVCKMQLIESKLADMFDIKNSPDVKVSISNKSAYQTGYDEGKSISLRREFKDEDQTVLIAN